MSGLVRVEPVALLPTPAGCAVFLGDGKKVIVFYIDPAIGASINAVPPALSRMISFRKHWMRLVQRFFIRPS